MEKEIQNILIYFGIGMMIIVPIGIYGFMMIDKLIKQMYNSHNEEWIKVGKPSGMFYYPPEARNLQSMISMQSNVFVWIFKTPKWIKGDEAPSSYLKKLRVSLAIANLSILGIFAFMAITIIGLTK